MLEALGDIFRQIVITDHAGGHHGGWIQRTLLIGPDHGGQGMPVGDILRHNSLQNFHGTDDAQNTVIVAAVLHRVAVGCHDDSLSVGITSGDGGIHITHIICGDGSADLRHSLSEIAPGLFCRFGQGIAGNTAVDGVAKGGSSMYLFGHSGQIAFVHKWSLPF